MARSTEGGRIDASVFVGHYEARVSPIADTDPATNAPATARHDNLDDRSDFAPGTYEFIVTARGYGAVRFREEIGAGQFRTIRLDMAPNVASRSQGATASGDAAPVTTGTPPREVLSAAAVRENLIDDTEETHWQAAANDGPDGHSVDGRQVTVDLAGNNPHRVNRVQVSAMLGPVFDAGPPACGPDAEPLHGAARSSSCGRATRASRTARRTPASAGSTRARPDAFPADAPRPVSPTLLLREFTFARDTDDAPAARGEAQPVHRRARLPGRAGRRSAQRRRTATRHGSAATRFVRAAELQAFEGSSGVR